MITIRWLVGASLLLGMTGAMAAAGGGGGGGMPWEQGTTAFVDSITGPWAAGIALMAICVSGAVLVFGGELNAFGRSMAFIILVTSVIMGAAQLLPLFTGGAVLPDPAVSQLATSTTMAGTAAYVWMLLGLGMLAAMTVLRSAKTLNHQPQKRA